ncbi:hypothetical protein KR018_010769 [Drosophila ironensis]|nr:hypothetical protein KR018_010769 [Drosophila ironensis]
MFGVLKSCGLTIFWESLHMMAFVVVEVLHLRNLLFQPFKCSQPDLNSTMFIMAVYFYLQGVEPLRLPRVSKNTNWKMYFLVFVMHTLIIYLALATIWDVSGCLLQRVLPRHIYLLRFFLAATLFCYCFIRAGKREDKRRHLLKNVTFKDVSSISLFNIWSSVSSSTGLGNLRVHHRKSKSSTGSLATLPDPDFGNIS